MEQLKVAKPHLIIMVGIPGSGKSFFAENFAKSFNSPIVSSSVIRKTLFDDPTFESAEDYIVDKVTDYLLDEMLKTKQTIILKHNTDTRTARAAIYKKCRQAGYEPLLVWVQTDAETAKSRFLKQNNDKALAEKNFNQRTKQFAQPASSEKTVVISGKFTYISQQKAVLRRLAGAEKPNIESKVAIQTPSSQRYLIR